MLVHFKRLAFEINGDLRSPPAKLLAPSGSDKTKKGHPNGGRQKVLVIFARCAKSCVFLVASTAPFASQTDKRALRRRFTAAKVFAPSVDTEKNKRPPERVVFCFWWRQKGSNLRPHGCEPCALTNWAMPPTIYYYSAENKKSQGYKNALFVTRMLLGGRSGFERSPAAEAAGRFACIAFISARCAGIRRGRAGILQRLPCAPAYRKRLRPLRRLQRR